MKNLLIRIFGAAAALVALSATAPAAGWLANHGMDTATLQSTFTSNNSQGYTPVDISSANVNGSPVYIALWQNRSRPGYTFYYGMSESGLASRNSTENAANRRPVHLESYLDSNQRRYLAFWENWIGPEVVQDPNTALSGWAAHFQNRVAAGYRPLRIDVVPDPGGIYVSSLWEQRVAPEFQVSFGLLQSGLQADLTNAAAAGFRPVRISGYEEGGQAKLVVIYDKRPGVPVVVDAGLSHAAYQTVFNQRVTDGYRLSSVAVYNVANVATYGAVWELHERPVLPAVYAKTGVAIPELAGVEAAMENFMRLRGISSGTLCVAKDDTVVYERGFGWTDFTFQTPTQPGTLYRGASISKPVTASAIRKLSTDGALNLSAKVFDLGQAGGGMLNITPSGTPDGRLQDVTVQHLLDHKGGWDRSISGDPVFKQLTVANALGVPMPPSQVDVARWNSGQALDHTPGATYAYSNYGYMLLGLIIEQVTGEDATTWIRNNIFVPSGAVPSDFQLGRTLLEDRSHREPAYFDPAFGGYNALRPAEFTRSPDATYSQELLENFGGWIFSSRGYVKFLQNYWISGQPKTSANFNYAFFGSLPGTRTATRQRNGISWAAFFNQRSDASGLSYDNIRIELDAAIDAVTVWPTTDPNPKPVITSALSGSATINTPFTYQITASGDPLGYGAIGLPSGLVVDTNTGAITGMPTGDGDFPITISAWKTSGESAAVLNLAVIDPSTAPLFALNPANQIVTAGQNGVFSSIVTGTPAPTLRWQHSLDGGNTWSDLTDVSGVTGTTGSPLTLSSVTVDMSGRRYRVVASNRAGTNSSSVATLTVNPANSSLSWATPDNITYGTALGASQLNASSGAVPGSIAYNPAAGTILSAGNHTLLATFTPSDTNNYSPASSSVSVVVDLALLTVRATDVSRLVGQPNPPLNAGYTGFVNGEGPSALTSLPVVSTPADVASVPGVYPVNVSGTVASNYVVSHVAGTLTIGSAVPMILEHPTNELVQTGGSAAFGVQVDGAQPLFYQWRKDGAALADETNQLLQIASVAVADRGLYDVVVSNSFGSAISQTATLGFSGPPVILANLTNVTVPIGGVIRLKVIASGTPPFTYEWYKLITRLPINGPELVISNAQPADAGVYHLAVRNSFGFVGSAQATVTVAERTTITFASFDPAVMYGRDIQLAPTVSGLNPLHLQWFKDSLLLSDRTNANLWISNAVRSDAGLYRLLASNHVMSVSSSNVLLRVRVPQRMQMPEKPIGGRFRLRFGAADGQGTAQASNLVLQASDDFTNWMTLSTNGSGMVLTNGQIWFDDLGATGRLGRFYRVYER